MMIQGHSQNSIKPAAYIMKNVCVDRYEGRWHYCILDADGNTVKDVYGTPDDIEATPEYAKLTAISPMHYFNLVRRGSIHAV